MSQITLPLESTITLRKNGNHTIKHHTFVTGEVGQEFAEAAVALMGSTVEDVLKKIDARNAEKEAVNE